MSASTLNQHLSSALQPGLSDWCATPTSIGTLRVGALAQRLGCENLRGTGYIEIINYFLFKAQHVTGKNVLAYAIKIIYYVDRLMLKEELMLCE